MLLLQLLYLGSLKLWLLTRNPDSLFSLRRTVWHGRRSWWPLDPPWTTITLGFNESGERERVRANNEAYIIMITQHHRRYTDIVISFLWTLALSAVLCVNVVTINNVISRYNTSRSLSRCLHIIVSDLNHWFVGFSRDLATVPSPSVGKKINKIK
jgi:hypothetical protein